MREPRAESPEREACPGHEAVADALGLHSLGTQ